MLGLAVVRDELYWLVMKCCVASVFTFDAIVVRKEHRIIGQGLVT